MAARMGVCAVLAAWGAAAQAQLYVPPKGSGLVSATAQVVTDHWHLNFAGDKVGPSRITTNTLVLRFEYGLTDNLAVNLTAPYTEKKFRASAGGAPAHDPDLFNDGHDDHVHEHVEGLDDGRFHGHWQDWGVGLRYRVRDVPLAVTAFANYSWPSHDYTFYAHAAPGTRQKRTQIGIAAGRPFAPPWINTYAQASYSYTFVEKVLDLNVDYSTLNLEVGYHFSPRLTGRVFATYRKTHGGLDFPVDFPWTGSLPVPDDEALVERFLNHDRIQRIDYVNAGVGLAFQLNEHYSLSLDYLQTLWGENGHKIHNAVSLGVYRSF